MNPNPDSFSPLTLENFEPGRMVRYVPTHANGDLTHQDCDDGVTTTKNNVFAFVAFGPGQRGKACKPEQLFYL
jgi:hypothetical protein